jgi:hypothetical protein
MPSQLDKRQAVLRVCAGKPLSTTTIAERLGRGSSDTKALAERLVQSKELTRGTHPTRPGAWLYQVSQQGTQALLHDPPLVHPDNYLVLIADSLDPKACHALTEFVWETTPLWMVRVHGRFRLIVAYADQLLADGLQAAVNDAAQTGIAAILVRVDQQRVPRQLRSVTTPFA